MNADADELPGLRIMTPPTEVDHAITERRLGGRVYEVQDVPRGLDQRHDDEGPFDFPRPKW